MRRGMMISFALILAFAMMSPGVALAAKGGNGGSVGHRAEPKADHAQAALEREQAKEAFREEQRLQREEAALEREQVREERVTGQENAVSRVERNLNRMATKMTEGKRKQLPPGLSATWLKFMNALGIDVGIEDLPGSIVETDTVDPDIEEPDDLEGSDALEDTEE